MAHGSSAVEPQRLVAEPLHHAERVRHQEDGLSPTPQLGELVETLVGEALVADREDFIHQQHVGVDVNGNGEAEPAIVPQVTQTRDEALRELKTLTGDRAWLERATSGLPE